MSSEALVVSKHGKGRGRMVPNRNVSRVYIEKKPMDKRIADRNLNMERDWENELARNILSIYHASSNDEGNGESPPPKSPKKSSSLTLPSINSPTKAAVTKPSPQGLNIQQRKSPKQIWFRGSGALRTVWCGLTEEEHSCENHDEPKSKHLDPEFCNHRICAELRTLENAKKYEAYLDMAHSLLVGCSRRTLYKHTKDRQIEQLRSNMKHSKSKKPEVHKKCGHTVEYLNDDEACCDCDSTKEQEEGLAENGIDFDLLDPSLLASDEWESSIIMMWRQFVVCCYTFGVRYTEMGNHSQGFGIMKRAEEIIEGGSAMEGGNAFVGNVKLQFQAFLWDNFAMYYVRRRKLSAAAQYCQKAVRAHCKMENWEHAAKCYLHLGAILSMQTAHEESIATISKVLEMVEDEKLQSGGTNPEKICMIAVSYHNLAVEQYMMKRPAEAAVSSQNARRLARISLSYSNRWIENFESTHQAVLKQLAEQHAYLNEPSRANPKKGSSIGNSNKPAAIADKPAARIDIKKMYKSINNHP